MSNTLFYIFAALTMFAALMVITVVNPVHSVLFLVLVFLNAAGMLFVLQLEFIPLTFIIVYVGAIAILFLFVVMMLDIKVTSKANDFFNRKQCIVVRDETEWVELEVNEYATP